MTIEIKEKTFDFGKISPKDTIKYVFQIKNISKIPFKINQVGTSCGCTSSNYTKQEVMKNGTAKVSIIYIPQKGKMGEIKEPIVLDCNVDKNFITLYLKGEVEEN